MDEKTAKKIAKREADDLMERQTGDIAAASGERGAALEPARKVKFTFPCVFIPPQSS